MDDWGYAYFGNPHICQMDVCHSELRIAFYLLSLFRVVQVTEIFDGILQSILIHLVPWQVDLMRPGPSLVRCWISSRCAFSMIFSWDSV